MTRDNDTAVSLDSFSQYRAGNQVWIWVSPVLLVVGSIGNILSFLVLIRKSLRQSTTMFYLACLSLADLFTLYTGLLRYWIKATFDVDVRTLSDFSCKVHTFLVYASLDFTVWILVAMTVDRCLSVSMPFRAKRLCPLHRARYVLCIILTLIALKNMQFLWTLGLVDTWELEFRCGGQTDNKRFFLRQIWPWIDFTTFCLIPFPVMIACDVKIIYEMVTSEKNVNSHIKRYSKKHSVNLQPELTEAQPSIIAQDNCRESRYISENVNPTTVVYVNENTTNSENINYREDGKCGDSQSPDGNCSNVTTNIHSCANSILSRQTRAHSHGNNSHGNNSHEKTVVSTTQSILHRRKVSSLSAMLLTVNCVFLLTTFPIEVFLVEEVHWYLSHFDDPDKLAWHNFWWAIVNILQYLNNAIHLFLYCLTGPRFRQELKSMFRKVD